MKGFAITLDAVVALSFVLFAMMIITTQTYQPRAPGGIYLKQLTLDAITVMEKTGAVEQALDGNATAMQTIIEASPKLACMSVSIMNVSGDVMTSMLKSDCAEIAGLDVEVSARPVLYQGNMYIIKSESWFRKEPDQSG
jgi:hypothetical protein